jgi:nucleoid-associated protein YgaU
VATPGDAESCRLAGRRIKPPGSYVVAAGDSLWEIAEKHYGDGERYAVLERANRKLDPDVIHPCQRVYVPAVKARR